MPTDRIEAAYAAARQQYADHGVDTGAALAALAQVPVSLHCWQGDDVGGFENFGESLGGGIAATGNYPGRARTPDELRSDAAKALSLIPGTHRFNLHAFYGEFGGKRVDRDEIGPEHFAGWIDWAKSLGHRPRLQPDVLLAPQGSRQLHAGPPGRRSPRSSGSVTRIACRRVGAAMGAALGTPCVTNHWIPDGMKDTPVDRLRPRERLIASLDEIFQAPVDRAHNLDALEGKLFGLGIESYTVGSHEFYFGYALSRKLLYTLDTGHYHPTETIADKISAVLMFVPEILLHVSRGVRWDSDHVVVLNDDIAAIGQELVRGNFLGRTHLGLDFFDASINRIAAWVVGTRNMLKSLLAAMIEPTAKLRAVEAAGDYTSQAGAAGRVQDAAARRRLGLLLRNQGCACWSVLAFGGQAGTSRACCPAERERSLFS